MPSSTDRAELTTEQVLRRDIPWKTYLTTKLIDGPTLQLLQCYDNLSEKDRASLIDEDGPTYIRVFVSLLRDISREETVEYVLALIDEMLSANPRRARFFHDESLVSEDTYRPFLRLLWNSNWFIQERSCKALSHIVSMRPRSHGANIYNNEASNSKEMITTIDYVLRGLLDWLFAQIKKPSHPTYSVQTAINSLAILLKEHCVRISFVRAGGVKLLIPLISPASSQQSVQSVYELCLCIWLLSYCDVAVDRLASDRVIPQLLEVVKGSTKEKVVRIVIMIFKNLLSKGTFGAQMVNVGLLQIVQHLKAQSWSDEDLLEALNILEEGLIDNIKKLNSFDQYKREVLHGQLDWTPMHKDPGFWRENIMKFEENDFQIVRVLITALDTSNDSTALAVACHDLSQFIRHHPAGRMVVSNMKAKELVMKLMDHEQAEVTKNALLCVQRLFLGTKYVNFLQA